jgi:hypothetical protein
MSTRITPVIGLFVRNFPLAQFGAASFLACFANVVAFEVTILKSTLLWHAPLLAGDARNLRCVSQ